MLIDENFPKDEFSYTLLGRTMGVRNLGDGLVTLTDHNRWKHKRSLLNNAFLRRYA